MKRKREEDLYSFQKEVLALPLLWSALLCCFCYGTALYDAP